nr:EOG090X0HLW [Eurycercus lamellatus]
MKFRFCGDQDCPDWFLTQMATLSRLSSIKAKLLAQHVARHLSGQEIDLGKTDSLLADSKLHEKDVRSLLASLEFVLSSASRFDTSEDHLRAELQQVGLPKEHAAALAKVHNDTTGSIRQRLIDNSLMINKLQGVEWHLADGVSKATGLIELELKLKDNAEPTDLKTLSFSAEPAKLQTLLFELEKIRGLMVQNGLKVD